MAAIPQEIWYATSLLPDSVTPFYMGGALHCALCAQRQELGRRAAGWYAGTAFFVFCCFEARATGGVLLVPLALFGLSAADRPLLRAALPGVLFFVMVAVTWGALGLVGHDYAIQLRQLVQDGAGTRYTGTGQPFQHLFFMLPVLRLVVDLPELLHQHGRFVLRDLARYGVNTYLGLHYYVVWPTALYALFRLRRLPAVRLPLLVFLTLYAFFEFGSTSLTSYQPIWKYERFLTILSVPSSVLAGVVLAELGSSLAIGARLQRVWPALIALYLCVHAAVLEADTRFWGSPVPATKQTFARLKQLDVPGTFYVTSPFWEVRGLALMRLGTSKPVRFEQLSGVSLDHIAHAVVIFDPSYFEPFGEYQYPRADFDRRLFAHPPGLPGWRRLFEVRTLSLDRHASTIEVLLAP